MLGLVNNSFPPSFFLHTLSLIFFRCWLSSSNHLIIDVLCHFQIRPRIHLYSIICKTTGLSEVSLQNVFERSSFDSTRGGLPPALLLSEEDVDEAVMSNSFVGAGITATGIMTVLFLAVRPAPPWLLLLLFDRLTEADFRNEPATGIELCRTGLGPSTGAAFGAASNLAVRRR